MAEEPFGTEPGARPWGRRVFQVVVLAAVLTLVAFLVRGRARLALVPLAAVAVWLAMDAMWRAALTRGYLAVARERGARLDPVPWPQGPRLHWTPEPGVAGVRCALGPVVEGVTTRVARTRFVAEIGGVLAPSLDVATGPAPTRPGTAAVFPDGIFRIASLRAVVPIGGDPALATELLDVYTTGTLDRLARLAGEDGLRVSVGRDRVVAEIGRALSRPADLDALVEGGLAVLARARVIGRGGAVAFGANDPTEPNCAVCAAPLGVGPVAPCGKCAAPHHPACLDWAGRCGAFACGFAP